MLSVRQSTLESFRRLIVTDYVTEEELIRAVKGVPSPPSWQMRAGMAWHACLSAPRGVDASYCAGYCTVDGESYFHPYDVSYAIRCTGPGLCELPGGRILTTQRAPVEVTGQADHVHGLVIQDHKTRFSTPDARDYEQSLQWRLYLLIHQCQVFRYNLWYFAEPKDGYCALKDVVSFRFFRYRGMEADCASWVARFVDWAESRRLTPYLRSKS